MSSILSPRTPVRIPAIDIRTSESSDSLSVGTPNLGSGADPAGRLLAWLRLRRTPEIWDIVPALFRFPGPELVFPDFSLSLLRWPSWLSSWVLSAWMSTSCCLSEIYNFINFTSVLKNWFICLFNIVMGSGCSTAVKPSPQGQKGHEVVGSNSTRFMAFYLSCAVTIRSLEEVLP